MLAPSDELNGHRPLNLLFLITSLEVGGAETLLVNMMRRFNPDRIVPQVGCLKLPGELGEQIASEFKVHSELIGGKYDARVLGRLKRIMKTENIDGLITVGAGDKMFWGRLAARQAKVPAIISALHSTGWPDGVGRMNRWLTPITDAFIAVAEPHREYLIEQEKFPAEKVRLIPNGIDTDRFVFKADSRASWRQRFNIPSDAVVCGIVAALRPEKDHELFLRVAESVKREIQNAHFLIVGDGAERANIDSIVEGLDCGSHVHLAGNSHDIQGALAAMDLFALTSKNEASPVSILEAMSIGLPVVAPNVGSIDQAVIHGSTGFLAEVGNHEQFVNHWMALMSNANQRQAFGDAARQHVVQYGSLQVMTDGYTDLVEEIYFSKTLKGGKLPLPTGGVTYPATISSQPMAN